MGPRSAEGRAGETRQYLSNDGATEVAPPVSLIKTYMVSSGLRGKYSRMSCTANPVRHRRTKRNRTSTHRSYRQHSFSRPAPTTQADIGRTQPLTVKPFSVSFSCLSLHFSLVICHARICRNVSLTVHLEELNSCS